MAHQRPPHITHPFKFYIKREDLDEDGLYYLRQERIHVKTAVRAMKLAADHLSLRFECRILHRDGKLEIFLRCIENHDYKNLLQHVSVEAVLSIVFRPPRYEIDGERIGVSAADLSYVGNSKFALTAARSPLDISNYWDEYIGTDEHDSCPYEIYFVFRVISAQDATPITAVLDKMVQASDIYPEVSVPPVVFDGHRFVLESEEGDNFYVHYRVMEKYSISIAQFMDGNRSGIRDGVPLKFRCSTATLSALVKVLYKQELSADFADLLSELMAVGDYWLMSKLLDLCAAFIQYTIDVKHFAVAIAPMDHNDFDQMLDWFGCSMLYSFTQSTALQAAIHECLKLSSIWCSKRQEQVKARLKDCMKKEASDD